MDTTGAGEPLDVLAPLRLNRNPIPLEATMRSTLRGTAVVIIATTMVATSALLPVKHFGPALTGGALFDGDFAWLKRSPAATTS